ncbi:hypothetical protein ACWGRF_01970 [Streptomyces zhihengii]
MDRDQLTAHIANTLSQRPEVVQVSEIEPNELGVETTTGLFVVTVQTP